MRRPASASGDARMSPRVTSWRCLVRDLDADRARGPGSGRGCARRADAIAYAMSWLRPVTRLTLTPGRELELVAGHRRADGHADELGVDTEVGAASPRAPRRPPRRGGGRSRASSPRLSTFVGGQLPVTPGRYAGPRSIATCPSASTRRAAREVRERRVVVDLAGLRPRLELVRYGVGRSSSSSVVGVPRLPSTLGSTSSCRSSSGRPARGVPKLANSVAERRGPPSATPRPTIASNDVAASGRRARAGARAAAMPTSMTRRADGAGDGRERRRDRRAEQTAGVAQAVDDVDRRAVHRRGGGTRRRRARPARSRGRPAAAPAPARRRPRPSCSSSRSSAPRPWGRYPANSRTAKPKHADAGTTYPARPSIVAMPSASPLPTEPARSEASPSTVSTPRTTSPTASASAPWPRSWRPAASRTRSAGGRARRERAGVCCDGASGRALPTACACGAAMGHDSNTGLTRHSWIPRPLERGEPSEVELQGGAVAAVDRIHLAGDPLGRVAAQQDGERARDRRPVRCGRRGTPWRAALLELGLSLDRLRERGRGAWCRARCS